MSRPFLKLDHIDKTFVRGGATTEVLRDVNLTINPANMSRSSAIRAAASPRCSTSSPG